MTEKMCSRILKSGENTAPVEGMEETALHLAVQGHGRHGQEWVLQSEMTPSRTRHQNETCDFVCAKHSVERLLGCPRAVESRRRSRATPKPAPTRKSSFHKAVWRLAIKPHLMDPPWELATKAGGPREWGMGHHLLPRQGIAWGVA